MSDISEEYVINDIIDNLLLNKKVLFVSDKFTYNSIVYELKSDFEDIALYGFTFIEYKDNMQEIASYFEKFDVVICYLSKDDDSARLKCINPKNVIVY